MKKLTSLALAIILVLFLAGCSFISYDTEYNQDYNTTVTIRWWIVNARKGPGLEYGVVTQLDYGTQVKGTGNIFHNENDPDNPLWIEIILPWKESKTTAWITAESLHDKS